MNMAQRWMALGLLSSVISLCPVGMVRAGDRDWPSFRGHNARGFSAIGWALPTKSVPQYET